MPKVVVTKTKGLFQVTSDSNNSALNLGSGLVATPSAMTGVDEAAASAASTIPVDQTYIVVTHGNDANDRLYLPAPADVPDGKIYYISTVDGFELSSKGDGSTATTMNGVAVTDSAGAYEKEIAIAAGTAVQCIKVSSTAWAVIGAAAAADT